MYMCRLIPLVILLIVPFFVGAANTPTNFKEVVDLLLGIINGAIYMLFALAFLTFVWGVVNAWIIHGGDAEKVEMGRKFVLAAIITFVVLTSLWGIVRFAREAIFGPSYTGERQGTVNVGSLENCSADGTC